jgi:hypothetical protein
MIAHVHDPEVAGAAFTYVHHDPPPIRGESWVVECPGFAFQYRLVSSAVHKDEL